MEFEANNPFVRLYRHAENVTSRFHTWYYPPGNYPPGNPAKTDLCHMMRMVLYLPFIYAMQVLVVLALLTVLVFYPMSRCGADWWKTPACVGIVVAITAGIVKLVKIYRKRRDERERQRTRVDGEYSWAWSQPKTPTFGEVCRAYVSAKKEKYCPLVTIKENERSSHSKSTRSPA